MYQEPPPIPYVNEPSALVMVLERILRRDTYYKQFHHVFDATTANLGPAGFTSQNKIQCICGRCTVFLTQKHRSSLCHVCECGQWHTILWRGEKSTDEMLEDLEIRRSLAFEEANVNPFAVTGSSWLGTVFGKTKKKD